MQQYLLCKIRNAKVVTSAGLTASLRLMVSCKLTTTVQHFLFIEPTENRVIKPVMDKVFPFEQTNEAMSYVETGRAKGKVVVKVN